MKQLSTYIGYIVGILGFASIIWTASGKSAEKDYNVADLKKDVTTIQTTMATKKDFEALTFSVNDYALKSRNTDSMIVKNYNSLSTSWKSYVKNHTRDYDSLLKYFQGIEFELIIPNRPDVKMKIEQIK